MKIDCLICGKIIKNIPGVKLEGPVRAICSEKCVEAAIKLCQKLENSNRNLKRKMERNENMLNEIRIFFRFKDQDK